MISLRKVTVSAMIGFATLLGIQMAEYDVNSALQAYNFSDPANRKTWELIFGNTQNGINVANSVLFYRKQQPLYCPPESLAPTGPGALQLLREIVSSNPKLGNVPYGFALLLALQSKYPCTKSQ